MNVAMSTYPIPMLQEVRCVKKEELRTLQS